MRIVSPWFVDKYPHKIINIHPSLLPEFAGGMDRDVHAEVLEAGVDRTGCTLHFVDATIDEGPIILQEEVEIAEGETIESLKAKVQAAEGRVIIAALKLYSQGKISVADGEVQIND